MPDEDLSLLDQRTLRVRRDDALDRMRYASFAGFGSAVLAALMYLWIASDTGEWSLLPAMVVGPTTQALLAYSLLQRRSQLDAWGLMAVFVFSVAYAWVALGRPTGLIPNGILAFLYWRGLVGAIDHADLEAELRRRQLQQEAAEGQGADDPMSRARRALGWDSTSSS